MLKAAPYNTPMEFATSQLHVIDFFNNSLCMHVEASGHSSYDVWPRLNSLYENRTLVDGEGSPLAAFNFAFISSHVLPYKNKKGLADRYCSFPLKNTKHV